MRFVKPLDTQMLLDMSANHALLVTIEENVVAGGAGSGVNEYLQSRQISRPVINLGLPDHFVEHGTTRALLSGCGLDAAGILSAISSSMKDTQT